MSVKANPSGKQIIFTIVLYLVVGLGSGFVGGLLGVGGGIIIVPVLFLLFSQSGQYPSELVLLVAVATSLACIVFTSASAAYAQIKGGRVLWSVVKRILPPSVRKAKGAKHKNCNHSPTQAHTIQCHSQFQVDHQVSTQLWRNVIRRCQPMEKSGCAH